MPLPVPVQVRSKNDGSGVAASVSGVRRRSGSQGLRSPAAKRPLSAPVALQGWLHKQGSEGLMLWKKRWFVLSEYCLFYYKGQNLFHFLLFSVSAYITCRLPFPSPSYPIFLSFLLFRSFYLARCAFFYVQLWNDTEHDFSTRKQPTRDSSGFIENTCFVSSCLPRFCLDKVANVNGELFWHSLHAISSFFLFY